MHGQHHDRGARPLFLQLASRFEAIHVRHAHIHEHHVGQLASRDLERFASRTRDGDDLHVACTREHGRDALTNELVVIDEHHTCHRRDYGLIPRRPRAR